MEQPITLYDLADLRESRFGQPYPRHGLILLWWFADEHVEIDGYGRMMAQRCDPEHKSFGFHPFHNAEEILPDTDLPYYEMGNLHHPGTMPQYVTKNYDPDVLASNADRIVVSVKSKRKKKWFDEIYVTHHIGNGRFDEKNTFCISPDLIEIIQSMEWSDFIGEVKIRQRRNRRGRR